MGIFGEGEAAVRKIPFRKVLSNDELWQGYFKFQMGFNKFIRQKNLKFRE